MGDIVWIFEFLKDKKIFRPKMHNCPTSKNIINDFIVPYLFPKQALDITCQQYKSFENTVGKGEIACYEQFLLFPQCFYPFWTVFFHFIIFKIVVCQLFQFGRV